MVGWGEGHAHSHQSSHTLISEMLVFASIWRSPRVHNPVDTRVLPLALAALCCLGPGPSFSHGLMTDPSSRAIGTLNEDYQYCFSPPGCECGEFPDAGAVVATYKAGQTIQVTIDITLSNSSGPTFRFQLCPPDQLPEECFVTGEFATVAFDQSTGPRTYEIVLPSDLGCDPCVRRWK